MVMQLLFEWLGFGGSVRGCFGCGDDGGNKKTAYTLAEMKTGKLGEAGDEVIKAALAPECFVFRLKCHALPAKRLGQLVRHHLGVLRSVGECRWKSLGFPCPRYVGQRAPVARL